MEESNGLNYLTRHYRPINQNMKNFPLSVQKFGQSHGYVWEVILGCNIPLAWILHPNIDLNPHSEIVNGKNSITILASETYIKYKRDIRSGVKLGASVRLRN